MSIRTRVEPINLDIQAIIDEELSPAAQSRQLATFAREQLGEAQQINRAALGRVPPHETTVDQRRGAPIESVRPDGVVLFEFELLEELFAWIGEQLVLHSPVRTGRYQRSHIFLADGVEVEPGAASPQAREYVFLNVQPYARKIERGLSPQAPDGVYESVAVLANRRFNNIARVRFSFRSTLTASVGTARARRAADRATRQPAIVISL